MADNTFQVEITARIDQLEKALQKAEKDVNKASQAAKKSTASFGDFADSLSVLNVKFGGVGVNVGAMISKVKGAITAIKTATMATRGFSVALAATGIGAIVIALGALIGAFASTQRGTDALRKITLQFQYVMDALLGLLQGKAIKAFDRLKKAFEDPQQAVKDLWEAIKTNLLNRLQGVIDAVTAAGRAIGAAIRLDWDAATMEAKNFGEALLQAATGIEDLPGKIKQVGTELNNARKAGEDAGNEIARLDKQILQYKLATTKEMAKQELIFKEQQRLSRDTSLSAEAQLEAQTKAEAALKRMEQIEVGLLKLEIQREKATTNTSETLDEQNVKIAEMEAGVLKVNAKFTGMGKQLDENARRINNQVKLQQEINKELEHQKKLQQDIGNINIDAFDNIDVSPTESIIPDTFLTEEQVERNRELTSQIIQQFHDIELAANMVSSTVAGIVENGFNVLFDSSKGFEDFAEIVENSIKRMIASMAAATAKALIFKAIMSAFGGSAISGVGDLIRGNLGGQIGGINQQGIFGSVSGNLLQLATGRAQNGNSRNGR